MAEGNHLMKAAVLRGVRDLRLESIERPQPGAQEVLVKIRTTGVCGTDVHMWAGTNYEGRFPFVPGHEMLGEVVETGPGVTSVKVGNRVTTECFTPCRVCPVCRDGGLPAFCPDHLYHGFMWQANGSMEEYSVYPEERLHVIPSGMSDDEGALIEPISVAYHAIWGRGGGVAPHDRVGIFGAGPIGLLAAQIAKVSHAQVIVSEPAAFRKGMAERLGIDALIDPTDKNWRDQVMDLTEGQGFSLIVECSGNVQSIASTVEVIGIDGRIVLTGQSLGSKVQIELGKAIWKHAKIIGSCGSASYFAKTIRFVSKGLIDVNKVITHRFKLDQVLAAFEMGNRGLESGKIMLDIA